ncbi:hypothetical protein D3C84_1016740 [compost metagenome]
MVCTQDELIIGASQVEQVQSIERWLFQDETCLLILAKKRLQKSSLLPLAQVRKIGSHPPQRSVFGNYPDRLA